MIDTMHLFVTKRCTNNCPLCCNNNYKIEDIPIPTEEELSTINTVLITGGEPFLLGEGLNKIVNTLRARENIKNIYVYTSGLECLNYLKQFRILPDINGINFSPKSKNDWEAISKLLYYTGWPEVIANLKSNRLYVFISQHDSCTFITDNSHLNIINDCHWDMNCEVFFRIWIDNIEPRPNEIFRRLKNYD